MKNKQIEKIFFGVDKNLKSQYITYLSYLHIVNSLSIHEEETIRSKLLVLPISAKKPQQAYNCTPAVAFIIEPGCRFRPPEEGECAAACRFGR